MEKCMESRMQTLQVMKLIGNQGPDTYVVMYSGSAIYWSSRKQKLTATSTMESEYSDWLVQLVLCRWFCPTACRNVSFLVSLVVKTVK